MSLYRAPVYDRIGEHYARGRHADPRIAAQISDALPGAASVVNVGAGSGSYEPPDRLVAALGGTAQVVTVPIPADCTDGFNAAYWRRPGDYLDPEVWRAMSALTLIGEADRAAGMRHLQDDLDSGEWDRRWGHLRSLGELDLGYRVLIARP